MESHPMGVHDKPVLDFMGNKINEMAPPFFAINYNISTHYPNELPKSYKEKFPTKNFSGPMKSMNYYNESIQQFFINASKQPWYNNTIFIFCSDHWMYVDTKSYKTDVVQSFHIPVFIFDPSKPQQKIISSPVSQLDIINTIACIAGIKHSIISYGENLLEAEEGKNRVVFCKENATLYQAIDSSYVLGFNPVTGKTEFCYNYKTDLKRNINLIHSSANPIAGSLEIKMKAFLQTASYHYNKLGKYK